MSTLISATAWSLGALAQAVSALFLTARLCLWAAGVVTAWYEIVEKVDASPQKRPGQVISLTATALQQHNAEEAAAVVCPDVPPRRWPAHIPPIAGVSEMGEDESVDQWPIWGKEHPAAGEGAEALALAPPPAAAHAHAAAAADAAADEQHVLAATIMGGNVDLVKEPPKEVIRAEPGGGGLHKVKKPFFARKVEKWFVAPYVQKCEWIERELG